MGPRWRSRRRRAGRRRGPSHTSTCPCSSRHPEPAWVDGRIAATGQRARWRIDCSAERLNAAWTVRRTAPQSVFSTTSSAAPSDAATSSSRAAPTRRRISTSTPGTRAPSSIVVIIGRVSRSRSVSGASSSTTASVGARSSTTISPVPRWAAARKANSSAAGEENGPPSPTMTRPATPGLVLPEPAPVFASRTTTTGHSAWARIRRRTVALVVAAGPRTRSPSTASTACGRAGSAARSWMRTPMSGAMARARSAAASRTTRARLGEASRARRDLRCCGRSIAGWACTISRSRSRAAASAAAHSTAAWSVSVPSTPTTTGPIRVVVSGGSVSPGPGCRIRRALVTTPRALAPAVRAAPTTHGRGTT